MQRAVVILVVTVLFCTAAAGSSRAQRPSSHTTRIAHHEAKSKLRSSGRQKPFTPGQDNFDAVDYRINIALDPLLMILTGDVSMHADVVSPLLTRIELDLLNNMVVDSVTSGGVTAAFTHTNDIIDIMLDRTYVQGETVDIAVYYHGTPDEGYGSFGFDTYNTNPMIWTLSEPYGARSWWPCKDVPSDKADSVYIDVTVPAGLTAVSNGTLESVTGTDPVTFHWVERYPITTYLVSLAVHPYATWTEYYVHSPTDSMPVMNFAFPDHTNFVQPVWDLAVPMIEAYVPLLGEYPFLSEKYGHAEFLWFGGMEHQTCSSMFGYNSEYLVAHELAHQWYGDMITCQTFNHIWLNEGFATYAEALWSEVQYGTAQYHDDMRKARYFGPGTVYVADTTDVNRIFDSGLSYDKGSWVLHMLRHTVGDATFFDILSSYRAAHGYGTATTEDFQAVCEGESGMDLDFFFQQWVYGEYYPEYSFAWSAVPMSAAVVTDSEFSGALWQVNVQLDQTQTNNLFKMPIDMTISTPAGDTTFVVWDSLATQTFQFVVNGEPTMVLIDKDEWILRTIQEKIANPTFHRGVLLVNGVDWATYGGQIRSAYQDSTFSGCYPITFWDLFSTPVGGYPSALPPKIGTGPVPVDTLKQFSVVIWVGNNLQGDLQSWFATPIYSYLEAGGDVLLMTRMGDEFLSGGLLSYLGVSWIETDVQFNTCIAAHPGLVNNGIIITQTLNALLDTTLTSPETQLLFTTTYSGEPRAVGAWHKPPGGGLHRTNRASFAYIGGRPFAYNHDDLRANVETILGDLFGEPKIPVAVLPEAPRYTYELKQNYPNPFNPTTTMSYSIAQRSHVSLRIYNVAGQHVRTLVDAVKSPESVVPVTWDGTTTGGQRVASGIYFYRLSTQDGVITRKMVLLK